MQDRAKTGPSPRGTGSPTRWHARRAERTGRRDGVSRRPPLKLSSTASNQCRASIVAMGSRFGRLRDTAARRVASRSLRRRPGRAYAVIASPEYSRGGRRPESQISRASALVPARGARGRAAARAPSWFSRARATRRRCSARLPRCDASTVHGAARLGRLMHERARTFLSFSAARDLPPGTPPPRRAHTSHRAAACRTGTDLQAMRADGVSGARPDEHARASAGPGRGCALAARGVQRVSLQLGDVRVGRISRESWLAARSHGAAPRPMRGWSAAASPARPPPEWRTRTLGVQNEARG